jgi:toxin YoeB
VKVLFTANGWTDYQWWQANDRKIRKRINLLIQDIDRNGAESGIGKPEPLRHQYAGYFSRRITDEHRLVYRVTDDPGDSDEGIVRVVACRYQYGR